MKKTLLGLLVSIVVLVGGFGAIAVITQVSDTIEDNAVARQSSSAARSEAAQPLDATIEPLEQTAEDCLPSELYDKETSQCYYECDNEESCLVIEAQLDNEFNELYESSVAAGVSEKPTNENPIATYLVKGAALELESGNNSEIDKHNAVWNRFKAIAGPDFINMHVNGFNVLDDNESETLAFVAQDEDNLNKWQLSVNVAAAFKDDKYDAKTADYTLIHEFAHVLSLNPTQVPPEGSASAIDQDSCKQFFTGEGCANEDAYIQAFYTAFWNDIYESLPEEGGESEQEAFYDDNEGAFLTEYASTNPVEDFAESFAAFVLQTKPTDSDVSSEKIAFFYEYEDLVTLRQEIRRALR